MSWPSCASEELPEQLCEELSEGAPEASRDTSWTCKFDTNHCGSVSEKAAVPL